MTTSNKRIYLLDPQSQTNIKSSVQIHSLNDGVVELIKNALDAQAQHIKVSLNYVKGFCSVLDDGEGIPSMEFGEAGNLGRAYCTSKIDGSTKTYGHNGRYIAALAGVSLLSITSRSGNGNTHTLWLDDTGRLRHIQEPDNELGVERGTRVKVYNLFSKIPVRSKLLAQRFSCLSEVHKELENLKHVVTAYILSSDRPLDVSVEHSTPAFNFQHKGLSASRCLPLGTSLSRKADLANAALRDFGYLDVSQQSDWKETTICTDNHKIQAIFSLEPMPYKTVQFMSLNGVPFTKNVHTRLFDLVNSMFDASSFGAVGHENSVWENALQFSQGLNSYGRRIRSKGVDRWPMFVLWISTSLENTDNVLQDSQNAQNEEFVMNMSNLLKAVIQEFLQVHGFRHAKSSREMSSTSTEKPDAAKARILRLSNLSQSRQPFQLWSRTKSSRASDLDDVLSGLPFLRFKQNALQPILKSNPVSVPRCPTSDVDLAGLRADLPLAERLVESADIPERNLPWVDPQTGRLLHIDPRTGMVVSSRHDVDKAIIREDHAAGQGQYTGEQSRRRKSPILPLVQVAENIKRNSSHSQNESNDAVRSFALLNQLEESTGELATYGKKHRDPIRQMPEWCSGHHRGTVARLELPRILRGSLRNARVLGQVDSKFVLALVPRQGGYDSDSLQIILIDQHAADERCKTEALLKSVTSGDAVRLFPPLTFELPSTEIRLLVRAAPRFARWNILYTVTGKPFNEKLPCPFAKGTTTQQIEVIALPDAIAERCRLNPSLIMDVLREGIWSEASQSPPHEPLFSRIDNKASHDKKHDRMSGRHSPVLSATSFPPRLFEIINSRACRSAIMFNDELTLAQCEVLVGNLGECTLPFQCAHGRPSMAVLASLDRLPNHNPLASNTKVSTAISAYQKFFCNTTADQTRLLLSSRLGGLPTSGELKADPGSSERTYRRLAKINKSFNPPLNTIDDNLETFGDAYRAWIASSTAPVSSPGSQDTWDTDMNIDQRANQL